jgi:hypothetical protein
VAAGTSASRRKAALPLPADFHQLLDWTVDQTMRATNTGRPTVMEKIASGRYRARRGPRGEYLIDPESVRAERDAEFNKPLKKLSPRNPWGRAGDPAKRKANEAKKRGAAE